MNFVNKTYKKTEKIRIKPGNINSSPVSSTPSFYFLQNDVENKSWEPKNTDLCNSLYYSTPWNICFNGHPPRISVTGSPGESQTVRTTKGP